MVPVDGMAIWSRRIMYEKYIESLVCKGSHQKSRYAGYLSTCDTCRLIMRWHYVKHCRLCDGPYINTMKYGHSNCYDFDPCFNDSAGVCWTCFKDYPSDHTVPPPSWVWIMPEGWGVWTPAKKAALDSLLDLDANDDEF